MNCPQNDNETLYRNKTTKQTPMTPISSPGCFPCLPAAWLVQSLLQLMKNRLLCFQFYSYNLCALPHFPWAETERGPRIEETSPPTDGNSDILVSQIPLLISKSAQAQVPLSKYGGHSDESPMATLHSWSCSTRYPYLAAAILGTLSSLADLNHLPPGIPTRRREC